MISGLVLKYLNGECFVIRRGYETTLHGSSSFCLTVPWKDNKRNGHGTFTGYDGSKIVGEWKNDKFLYGDKIAPPLLIAFINLSEKDRKKVQSVLLDLGFYNSLIDGMYGKWTSEALTAYYEKNSGIDDVKNTENAIRLLSDLLKI